MPKEYAMDFEEDVIESYEKQIKLYINDEKYKDKVVILESCHITARDVYSKSLNESGFISNEDYQKILTKLNQEPFYGAKYTYIFLEIDIDEVIRRIKERAEKDNSRKHELNYTKDYIQKIMTKIQELQKELLKNNQKYFKIQCLKHIDNDGKRYYKSPQEIAIEINNFIK